jgi:hypothetical protein
MPVVFVGFQNLGFIPTYSVIFKCVLASSDFSRKTLSEVVRIFAEPHG